MSKPMLRRSTLGARLAALAEGYHDDARELFYELRKRPQIFEREIKFTVAANVSESLTGRVVKLLFGVVFRLAPLGTHRRKIVIEARNTLFHRGHPQPRRRDSNDVKFRVDPAHILFPFSRPENPRVSIIIPSYGDAQVTLNCLASISAARDCTTFEIIVIDDCSPENSGDILQDVAGIHLIQNRENIGFLLSVNTAAALARGEILVLLNNDVTVIDGWLDHLVATLDADTSVGAVGSKLLFPNGKLQEAGSLIYRDGSGANYGKWEDPTDDKYEFPREVDYCSAASLAIRRSLWEQIGGFDARYAPAYYEDTDLCFSIRAAGFSVWYQPLSLVVHAEGGSYGTDESPRKQQLMAANRESFLSKWSSALAAAHPPVDGVRRASWRSLRGRILIVDHQVPTCDRDSGSVRMWEITRILRELGFAVTFIAMTYGGTSEYIKQLRATGVEVICGSANTRKELSELGPELVAVVLSRPSQMWSFARYVREFAPSAHLFYDTVDLHFLREQRHFELEHNPAHLRASQFMRVVELGLAEMADTTIVVSNDERNLLNDLLPELSVAVISNIHRERDLGPIRSERDGLMFVGNFHHPPNLDAMRWFISEIFPLVTAALPQTILRIIGSGMPADLAVLSGPNIENLGWVKDLTPVYHRTAIAVAPLRFGAGVKGKIGEALSYGIPVVSTGVGVEGMHLHDGVDICVRENPASFAAAIVNILSDDAEWNALAVNGRRAIHEMLGVEPAKRRLEQLLIHN